MSEEAIILHCAPTLANLKTANLFNCRFDSRETMQQEIRELNRQLHPKGLRVMPFRYEDNKALIYIYRPARLKQDFQHSQCRMLLQKEGYRPQSCGKCVAELMRRLRKQKDFPHEIGLFLGYPPEDVEGFITHKAADCKCVGYWKVYGDAEQAQKTFEKYRRCTSMYMKVWKKGRSVEQLAVRG